MSTCQRCRRSPFLAPADHLCPPPTTHTQGSPGYASELQYLRSSSALGTGLSAAEAAAVAMSPGGRTNPYTALLRCVLNMVTENQVGDRQRGRNSVCGRVAAGWGAPVRACAHVLWGSGSHEGTGRACQVRMLPPRLRVAGFAVHLLERPGCNSMSWPMWPATSPSHPRTFRSPQDQLYGVSHHAHPPTVPSSCGCSVSSVQERERHTEARALSELGIVLGGHGRRPSSCPPAGAAADAASAGPSSEAAATSVSVAAGDGSGSAPAAAAALAANAAAIKAAAIEHLRVVGIPDAIIDQVVADMAEAGLQADLLSEQLFLQVGARQGGQGRSVRGLWGCALGAVGCGCTACAWRIGAAVSLVTFLGTARHRARQPPMACAARLRAGACWP